MSHTNKTTSSTSHLLSSAPTTSPHPIPSSSALAINTLALGRIAFGVSAILAPAFTFGLFRFPIPATLMVLPRMFGVRELMVGEFLWTAESKRETRKAILMGMGVDAVDFASVAYGLATGTVGRAPAGLVLGGAVGCLMMGAWGLRGCKEE